jgi:hypothetical protein
MAKFSIFALGESQLTISGGEQLDGITQGDGSHLLGLTITLNSGAWTEMQLRDNDTNFGDNDSGQRFAGTQDFDGTTYSNGARVEAEYGLLLSDGVNTWQVVGFNVNNSSPSYATVEGLAFIGGAGGFPPVGVPLTVISAQEGPNFAAASYATPICFDRGTLIDTGKGLRAVETLRPGDLVHTLDHGLQPLRWIGGRHAMGVGRFTPVEIAPGVLGNARPLRVSQQHRILVTSPLAELHFGEAEVFVCAGDLVDGDLIRLVPGVSVQYFHLLFDQHQIVFGNGIASESFLPGPYWQDAGDAQMLAEVHAAMPGIATYGPAARHTLKRHEAAMFSARALSIEFAQPMRHIA